MKNRDSLSGQQSTERVIELAGIALGDVVVNTEAGVYFPTLHISATSFWSGTKIQQFRYATYPDVGLIELGRKDGAQRIPKNGAWAFGCVGRNDLASSTFAFVVEAGGAPLTEILRVVQDFTPPSEGFRLNGPPRFSFIVQGQGVPVDPANVEPALRILQRGISRLPPARDKWPLWMRGPS